MSGAAPGQPFVRGGALISLTSSPRRCVVGIGEFAVSNDREAQIVTHALGSCVAICVWDPVAGVAGLMHVLLPDSRVNPARALVQPAAFADTGIPLLLRTACEYGVVRNRCVVRVIGGADVSGLTARFENSIGQRNVAAARTLLRLSGVSARTDAVGGTVARTVTMSVGDGRVQIATTGPATEAGK